MSFFDTPGLYWVPQVIFMVLCAFLGGWSLSQWANEKLNDYVVPLSYISLAIILAVVVIIGR